MRRNISSRFKNMVHLFGFGLLAIVAFAHVAASQNMPQSFADIVEDLMPAVVNISISTTVQNPPGIQMSPFEDFFEEFMERDEKESPKKRRVSSLGSGFVIDPSGIVITNNHVVENADEIIVNFSNGEKFKAELLGRDPKTDLAVLKVITDKKLPFVKFGDNTKARVGDWVIAIGNPFGLGGSLSVGVISAINRDINSGPYDSYIQTDAAINKGNSGGPLFNLDGEVIGVNTAIISPTGGSVGIGFSIPADMAQIVITQLREYGETRRGWLGVRIQRITEDLAESLGLSKPKGALVSEIIPGGPADEAGMKQGDVILSFDGKEVAEMRDLPRIVAETPIDKAVQVKVQRRGKVVKLKVKVGRLEESNQLAETQPANPKKQTKQPGLKLLGLTLETLDAKTRARAGLDDDKEGVLIAQVDADSSASESGVKSGDIIVEVDQTSVAKPQDVEDLVNKAKKAGKKSILVLMHTPQGLRFVAIKI